MLAPALTSPLFTFIALVYLSISLFSMFVFATQSPPSMLSYRKFLFLTCFWSVTNATLMGILLQPHALVPIPCFQISGYFSGFSEATLSVAFHAYMVCLVNVGSCLSINSTCRYLIVVGREDLVRGKRGILGVLAFHAFLSGLVAYFTVSSHVESAKNTVNFVCFYNLNFLHGILAFFLILVLTGIRLNLRIIQILEKSGRQERFYRSLRSLVVVPVIFGMLPIILWTVGSHVDLGIAIFVGECVLMTHGISNSVLTLVVFKPYRNAIVRLWRKLWKKKMNEENLKLRLFVISKMKRLAAENR